MQFNPKALILTALSLAILWAAINWQSSVLGIAVGAFLSLGLWMYFTEGVARLTQDTHSSET
jgi:hypothetical protein